MTRFRPLTNRGGRRGFTLIELLIVIAIILILIAIALPNFLEARTRAVVTQVQGELRTIAIALELYSTDHQSKFPLVNRNVLRGTQYNRSGIHNVWGLTTPIEYITRDLALKGDPFAGNTRRSVAGSLLESPNQGTYNYGYLNVHLYRVERNLARILSPAYFVNSKGPDTIKGPNPVNGGNWFLGSYGKDPGPPYYDRRYTAWQYSPTNGTRSKGDINRVQ